MASVIVGCKLPHGLRINLGEEAVRVDTPDPRDRYVVVTGPGKSVALNGTYTGKRDGLVAVGGYGITRVDDGDAMRKWLADNDNNAAVKAGLIFIASSNAKARDEATERKELLNGTEPLDYDNPLGDKSIEPTKTIEQAKADAADQAAVS